MRSPTKKLLTIASISVFSLGLIWGAWAFTARSDKDLYKASDEAVFLKASSEKNPGGVELERWERELVERENQNLRSNYTETVARGVMEEYFRARAANAAVDEEQLVEDFLSRSLPEEYKIDFKEYNISDLKITSQNDAGVLKNYGNKLGEASIKNVYDQSLGNEAEILSKAVQLNREKEFEKLEPIIKNYENLIGDLLKIETPTELVSTHLNIINSLSKILSSVRQFNLFLKDPLKGLFIMTSYAGYTADLQDYMKELNRYMREKEITFEEKEPGSLIERASNISLE